jgi:hypothetical protein
MKWMVKSAMKRRTTLFFLAWKNKFSKFFTGHIKFSIIVPYCKLRDFLQFLHCNLADYQSNNSEQTLFSTNISLRFGQRFKVRFAGLDANPTNDYPYSFY